MSSILDALKKAQAEEKEKKEKGAERVVYLVPKKTSVIDWIPLLRRAALAAGIGFLGLCVWIGINTLRTQPAQVTIKSKKQKVVSKNTPAARPAFKLSGILWDNKEPYAIVNSEMVKKGDLVGEALVTAISQNSVELSYKDVPQILSLEKE